MARLYVTLVDGFQNIRQGESENRMSQSTSLNVLYSIRWPQALYLNCPHQRQRIVMVIVCMFDV